MAHVYGEKVEPSRVADAQQYRGVFSDYLRRTRPMAAACWWCWMDSTKPPVWKRGGFVSNRRARPFARHLKDLSLKNCRQRCGPLHAPSGHNFSKLYKCCSPSLPSRQTACLLCAKPPAPSWILPNGGREDWQIKRDGNKRD
jgi:hypothetical protein